MNEPVTVLLATRDRVPLLDRALRSIWEQSYPGELRVIVVFDGPIPSDQATLTRPHRTAHRLEIVRNEQAPGLAGARNHGLALAQTEWVAILDDDDVWLPDKLDRQTALLARCPETPLVGGGIDVLTRGSRRRRAGRAVVTHADLLAERVMQLHSSTFLIRRDALHSVGGWDTELTQGQGEDYDLLLRLARSHGPIVSVVEPVAEIHWDSGSYYRSNWAALAEALERLLEQHPEFASNPRGRARVEGQIAYAYAALGKRTESWRWQRRARRDHRTEPRAVLAAMLTTGLISSRQVERILHGLGRGI